MSLSLTTQELLNARVGLLALGDYSIPDVKGSYALAKIKRAANGALEDLEVARIGLCEQHAHKDDLGKPKKKDDGSYDIADQAGFSSDWNVLMAQPVELVGCRALAVEEFAGATLIVRSEDGKSREIVRGVSPDLLFSLGPLVVETAPEPAAPKKN